MWSNPHFPLDMVTFTEEILNGKLYFLCSDILKKQDCFIYITIVKHYGEVGEFKSDQKDFAR